MENTDSDISATSAKNWLLLEISDNQIYFIVKCLCYFSCCSSIYTIIISLYEAFTGENPNDQNIESHVKEKGTVHDTSYVNPVENDYTRLRIVKKKKKLYFQRENDIEKNTLKMLPTNVAQSSFEEMITSYVWSAKSIFINVLNLIFIAVLFSDPLQRGVSTTAVWILGSTMNTMTSYILGAVLLMFCSTERQRKNVKCEIVMQILGIALFDIIFLVFGYIYFFNVISNRNLKEQIDNTA